MVLSCNRRGKDLLCTIDPGGGGIRIGSCPAGQSSQPGSELRHAMSRYGQLSPVATPAAPRAAAMSRIFWQKGGLRQGWQDDAVSPSRTVACIGTSGTDLTGVLRASHPPLLMQE